MAPQMMPRDHSHLLGGRDLSGVAHAAPVHPSRMSPRRRIVDELDGFGCQPILSL
jgi:hypothetical protein